MSIANTLAFCHPIPCDGAEHKQSEADKVYTYSPRAPVTQGLSFVSMETLRDNFFCEYAVTGQWAVAAKGFLFLQKAVPRMESRQVYHPTAVCPVSGVLGTITEFAISADLLGKIGNWFVTVESGSWMRTYTALDLFIADALAMFVDNSNWLPATERKKVKHTLTVPCRPSVSASIKVHESKEDAVLTGGVSEVYALCSDAPAPVAFVYPSYETLYIQPRELVTRKGLVRAYLVPIRDGRPIIRTMPEVANVFVGLKWRANTALAWLLPSASVWSRMDFWFYVVEYRPQCPGPMETGPIVLEPWECPTFEWRDGFGHEERMLCCMTSIEKFSEDV